MIDQALFGGLDTYAKRQSALDNALREGERGGDIVLLGDIDKSLPYLQQARDIFASLGADRRVAWVQEEIDQIHR